MRRTQAITALVAMVSGLLVLLAPAAPAQTYPPGPCTLPATGTTDVGTVEIGQRFVLRLAPSCAFNAGAPVTVTVNGVNIPGKTAEPTGGIVLVDITVVSATQLSIDDPVLTPAICGVNTVTASGPSTAQGGVSTQTANFRLNCPGAATTPTTAAPTTATPVRGRLSLTGANSPRYLAIALALMVAGSMFVVFTRRRRGEHTI